MCRAFNGKQPESSLRQLAECRERIVSVIVSAIQFNCEQGEDEVRQLKLLLGGLAAILSHPQFGEEITKIELPSVATEWKTILEENR